MRQEKKKECRKKVLEFVVEEKSRKAFTAEMPTAGGAVSSD